MPLRSVQRLVRVTHVNDSITRFSRMKRSVILNENVDTAQVANH